MKTLARYCLAFILSNAFWLADVNAAEPKLPTGPCDVSAADHLSAAQKCKELAKAGNADAMFQFGFILMNFAPSADNASEAAKWKSIGMRSDAAQWFEDAGNKGSDQAIHYLCNLGFEPSATPSQRAESKVWCEQL